MSSHYQVNSLHNNKYRAVIYSVSYDNPIYYSKDISNDLSNYIDGPCFVLFDLLLSNGQNFNRFVEGYYNGIEVEYNSMKVVSIDNADELNEINSFYQKNIGLLNNGILTPSERYLYARKARKYRS